MPSSRKKHWPPRWTEDRGTIYYRPRADERHLWDNKSFFRLGKTEHEAWRKWYERTADTPTGELRTLADCFDRYRRTTLPDLAEKTQREYARALMLLNSVFGHMSPASIKPRHVYAYMDRRPGVSGNRERAVLSAVMTQCVRWGLVDRNLVREVQRTKEVPRERYVRDAEVATFVQTLGKTGAGAMLRAYVRLKLLTGLRQGQILALRREAWNASSGELTAPAVKGGRPTVYSGDGLSDAVRELQAACRTGANVESLWLMPSRTGARYTSDGFRSIWQRAMAAYVEQGGERFRDHDLRAKVASDAEADHARALMGHRTAITERVYRRKPAQVAVMNLPHSEE